MLVGQTTQNPNPPHPLALLLRARREGPRGSRPAEQRDELAALHSITFGGQYNLLPGQAADLVRRRSYGRRGVTLFVMPSIALN